MNNMDKEALMEIQGHIANNDIIAASSLSLKQITLATAIAAARVASKVDVRITSMIKR